LIKPFILNTRFNPSIFAGKPLLFCEEQKLFYLLLHILRSLPPYFNKPLKRSLDNMPEKIDIGDETRSM
jgi:hypothetical protein